MEETIRKLNDMRLRTMASKVQELESANQLSELTPFELLQILVDTEFDTRKQNKISRLKRGAKLKIPSASMQELIFEERRNLKREKMMDLITGRFLEHKHNVLVSGATGVGKTYLLCALANLACTMGISTRYFRVSRLLELMEIEKSSGNYLKFLEKLARVHLLVLDDLGPDIMNKKQRSFFFDLIEERHHNHATIIGSQLPMEQWYHLFEDESIADAICDRLFHQAHRIVLKGESMRKN